MEIAKKKLHYVENGRPDKPKFKTRYATLGADSFTLYKKPNDSLGSEFIPTEKILGANIIGERSKKHIIEVVLDKMNNIFVGTDTPEECEIWANQLSRAKTLKELQNWVIHPDSIKLEKQIGVGAFGVVWKGSMCGAPVAVKEMRQSVGNDEVEKEIHLLSKIRNPYCVRLLGIYRNESASKLFIVTEFVDGGDLSGTIYNAPPRSLSEEVKLKILRDVARGVAFLHENQIIHRDLKTDNCLVRSTSPFASQFAVVADFGISKIAPSMGEAGSNLTMGVGTPVYMAPECFKKNYTTQLDVYSFGILMNEVFSEERPWSHVNTTFNAVIHDMVDEGKRPRFHFTAQDYPHCAQIQNIITNCWAGDPTTRWSMRKALEALDALITQVESNPNRPQSEAQFSRPATVSGSNPATRAHQPPTQQAFHSAVPGYGRPQQPPHPSSGQSSPGYRSQPGSQGGGSPYQSQQQPSGAPYQSQYGQSGGTLYSSVYNQSGGGGAAPGAYHTGGYGSQPAAPAPGGLYTSVPGQGSLYASRAGGYSPQTHVPASQAPTLPNMAGLSLNQAGGGARPMPTPSQIENDFASRLMAHVDSLGGEVPAPHLGQFVSSAGVSPRDAAIFVDHLAAMFSRPGTVTTNGVRLMKQWFFPIVVDPPSASGGAIYEDAPAALYEDSADTTNQVGWRIPQINHLLGSTYFKGFMDGPSSNAYLKERGTAPGQYILRFSGTEPGKLALSVLDYSMAVRHWKITLLPGGALVEATGQEFDSIASWLGFRGTNPFSYSQGTLAITSPCP